MTLDDASIAAVGVSMLQRRGFGLAGLATLVVAAAATTWFFTGGLDAYISQSASYNPEHDAVSRGVELVFDAAGAAIITMLFFTALTVLLACTIILANHATVPGDPLSL